MSGKRAGDPPRLCNFDDRGEVSDGGALDVGARSSMLDDLRIARGAERSSYDVDAGLARFSAMIAIAPGAAIGGAAGHGASGTSAGAGATVAHTGAATLAKAAPSVIGASGTSAATGGASVAATKLAVATKVGFSMKAIVATVLATGTIGVASYELATAPASHVEPSRVEVMETRGPVEARGPVELRGPGEARGPGETRGLDPVGEQGAAPPAFAPPSPVAASESSAAAAPDAPPPGRSAAAAPGSQASGSQSADSTPSSRGPVSSTPSSSVTPSAAASETASVKPEMDQLARVRRAGGAEEALRLAEEGHLAFPRGVFWQEREAVAINALSRLGRGPEAAARARAFLARHPESAYGESFRRIMGEPGE